MSHEYDLPRKFDPSEFEELCTEVLPKLYTQKDYVYERYGKNGQKQDGVDLLSKNAYDNKKAYAQCKNIRDITANKFLQLVQKETEKTYKKFGNDNNSIQIDKYFFLITIKRDAKYQDIIDRSWNISYPRPIIFYWEDIKEVIIANPLLIKRFYPEFYCDSTSMFSSDERYFYNPFNNEIKPGKIDIKPKYMKMENIGNGQLIIEATFYVCNGLEYDIMLNRYPIIIVTGPDGVIVEATVLLKEPLAVKAGKVTESNVRFSKSAIKTKALSIPNRLMHCITYDFTKC